MNVEQSIKHERCVRQGRLFELMAMRGLDMEDFADKYMNSEFCLLCMDGDYSRYQVGAMNYILDELDDEFLDQVKRCSERFDPQTSEWIGYLYRRMAIDSRLPSSVIYKAHPYREMLLCYPGYHTMSVPEASEQLIQTIDADVKVADGR